MGLNNVSKELKEKRIGEVNYNVQGQRMEIIDYIDYRNVTVRFEDGHIRENAYYSCFKDGSLKNYDSPDVYGVGISGYKKKKVNDKLVKEYRAWTNMLSRCYDPKRWEEFPRYKDCTVCEEWLKYDNFYDWCHSQENWDKVDNNPAKFHLDKDIIKKGNTVYGPDTCSFVPATVNTMFLQSKKQRGDLPIGVSMHPNGSYRARCNMNLIGEKDMCKNVKTPEEGFAFYKQQKERLIKEVAQMEYSQGNITKKCYDAMMNYHVEITD